ncbi:hypothetical protein WDU94_002478 [Cyamophila willieti]
MLEGESYNDTLRERIVKTQKQNAENRSENYTNIANEERKTTRKDSAGREAHTISIVWKETNKQYDENIFEEWKSKEHNAKINDENNIRNTSKLISIYGQFDVHRDALANGGISNHLTRDQRECQGNSHLHTNTLGQNVIEKNEIPGYISNEVSEQNYSDTKDTCKYNYGIRSTVSQITATLILNFLNFNYGMVVTMPTLLVGTLDSATALNETRLGSPQLILNDQQASWLGSILMLFHPLGALLAGHIQESMGRKHIMLYINIPFLICWFLLYSAQHVYILYIASIVMGVSLGCCEAPVASYIGEISEPKLRGAISLLTGFASSVGALVIYVLYTYTSWRVTFLLSAIIPSISLSVIGFLPESPVYLVSKDRPEDARKSLRWLRGWLTTEDPNTETMRSMKVNSNNCSV